MLPTKPGDISKDKNTETIQRVERLFMESQLGLPIMNYCSPLEWECLLQFSASTSANQRVAAQRTQALIEALCRR